MSAMEQFLEVPLLADSSRPDAQTRQRKAVLHGLASAGAFGRGATAC